MGRHFFNSFCVYIYPFSFCGISKRFSFNGVLCLTPVFDILIYKQFTHACSNQNVYYIFCVSYISCVGEKKLKTKRKTQLRCYKDGLKQKKYWRPKLIHFKKYNILYKQHKNEINDLFYVKFSLGPIVMIAGRT